MLVCLAVHYFEPILKNLSNFWMNCDDIWHLMVPRSYILET